MFNEIHISQNALRHNLKSVKSILTTAASVAPCIKGNGYGHGMKNVYEALKPENPTWYCVNYVSEGESLRTWGYQGRILVVGPALPQDIQRVKEADLDWVVGNRDTLLQWFECRDRPRIHLKVDTGMGRQGFLEEEALQVLKLFEEKKRALDGLCTHFANVEDVSRQAFAKHQLSMLLRVRERARSLGLNPLVHASASASALILEESHLDLVRLGISLYGEWPSSLTRLSFAQARSQQEPSFLKPVLTWKAQLTNVKWIPKGHYVGYGLTYRAHQDTLLGVVGVGYYEGYPRLAGEAHAYVLFRGVRCVVRGRICMNMLMVDLTSFKDQKVMPGDWVTLIGQDEDEVIGAHDLADWSRTIQYEVLSRLHPENPRALKE